MFLRYQLPAIIWTIVVLFLTLLPGDSFPDPPKFMDLLQPDKIVHIIMFAPLMLFFALSFRNQNIFVFISKNYLYFALIISVALGGITEKLQGMMHNGRKESIYDFIANTIGCLVGIFIFRFLQKRKIKYFL